MLSLGNVAALEADKASSCWSKCSGTPSKAVHYTTLMLLGEIRERERGEERPGILREHALKIPSMKHKLATSSFKEISETAPLACPSRQPRQLTPGHKLRSSSRTLGRVVKRGLKNCPIRADTTPQSWGRATPGQVQTSINL